MSLRAGTSAGAHLCSHGQQVDSGGLVEMDGVLDDVDEPMMIENNYARIDCDRLARTSV